MSWKLDDMTPKQKELVDEMVGVLGIEFNGTTKGEAAEYIKVNKDLFNQSTTKREIKYVSALWQK